MFNSYNLKDLAAEVARQQEQKRDYIAPVAELRAHSMVLVQGEQKREPITHLAVNGFGEFAVRDIAHTQIASYLHIPKVYYDRLRAEQPALLDENINTLLRAQPEARRMVRTMSTNARAFLSDRYRPLDNYDLLEHVLPVISDLNLQVESLGLTERNLALKVFSQTLMEEVRVGDVVRAGLMIRNSEVGLGALEIAPMTERLVCKNGMVCTDYAQRKYHVGRLYANTTEEDAREYFSDETKRLDDELFWRKAVETLRAVLSEEVFHAIVARMRASTERRLTGNPIKAVEVLAGKHDLNQTAQTNILMHLMQGGDLSQWGLANAVTRAAQDVSDYDDATALETIGGKVIELAPSDWRAISTAK